MTWLFVALGAYFCYSITTVLDKFILSRNQLPSPVAYVFYSGMIEGLAFVLVPFGFAWPGMHTALLAVFAGVLFITALLFLFNAIIRFEASKVSPIVGSGISVMLFALSFTRADFRMSALEIIAFSLLVFGGILISFKRLESGHFLKLIGFSLCASFFFALSYFIGKIAYGETNFITAFVLARAGGFLVALFLFALPQVRATIKNATRPIAKRLMLIVGANKVVAGVGLVSIQYAMSLGNVTLVQAMEGAQYIFLIFLTAILSRKWHHIFEEQVSFGIIARKTVAVVLIMLGIFILAFSEKPANTATGTKTFGMTFSQIYANDMGLDWKETYTALLDDVGIKHLRIPAYWTKIEQTENTFDFTDLDWQILEAQKRGADVVVVVGYRVPRWPECHIPDWAKDKPQTEFQTAVLDEITEIVMRYRDNPTIIRWQIENEPFLKFGVCPALDVSFLDREIALVRSLDKRPIIISDSGELSTWVQASRRADIFGTTMYRTIWNEYVGQFTYPLPPEFFHFKANIAHASGGVDKMIVIELQAEPWGPGLAHTLAPDVEAQSFSPDKFHATIDYVRTVGFPEAYLWGGEWWYFKKVHGDDRFWNIAKELYAQSL